MREAVGAARFEPLESRRLLTVTPIVSGPVASFANPANLVSFKHDLFYTAVDSAGHGGVWESNGTAAGTRLAIPFPAGTTAASYADLVVAGNKLFFTDTTNGLVYSTDGTAGGTALLMNFDPNHTHAFSQPAGFTAVGNELYFSGGDVVHGTELWKTDGTVAGTMIVKDIFPGAQYSDPQNLTNVNGTLFFFANDGNTGYELWKSDGTAAGTTLVKDIDPGVDSSGETAYNTNPSLFNVNGKLFFLADDGSHGHQVWSSDGTAAGTVQVSHLPSNDSTIINVSVTAGGDYLFADDGALYSTDGTTTQQLVDFDSGTFPSTPVPVGASDYFFAEDDGGFESLWRTDGSVAGTTEITAVDNGSGPSEVSGFGALNGTFYFGMVEGYNANAALYASDGTAAGTVPILTSDESNTSALARSFTNVDGALYFVAGSSTANTLYAIPDAALAIPTSPTNLTATAVAANEVDLHWTDNASTETGFRIERSATSNFAAITLTANVLADATSYVDATAVAGVTYYYRVVADNAAGDSASAAVSSPVAVPSGPAAPTNLHTTAVSGASVSLAWTDNAINEAGYRVERSATPDFSNVDYSVSLAANTTSYVDAMVNRFATYYYRVYAVTSAGFRSAPSATVTVTTPDTIPLAPTTLQATGVSSSEIDLQWVDNSDNEQSFRVERAAPGGTYTTLATVSANQPYFQDVNAGSLGTWQYRVEAVNASGASAATNVVTASTRPPTLTTQVADVNGAVAHVSAQPTVPVVLGGFAYYFAADTTDNVGLWRTDGTAAGTTLVRELYSNVTGAMPTGPVVSNGVLYFLTNNQSQLWRSDGTAAGTVLVKDTATTGGSAYGYQNLAVAAGTGRILFSPDGKHLWSSDGTAAGTLLTSTSSIAGAMGSLVSSGSYVFFTSADAAHGTELWKSDGTAAGTALVSDVYAGTTGSSPGLLTPFKTGVLFQGTDAAHGAEAWFSDGTAAGTVLLADAMAGATGSYATHFAAGATKAYFVATTTGAGAQAIYVTDGTPAGTSVLKTGITPDQLAVVGPTLYIGAYRGSAEDLYASDGTPAGTTLLQTVANGGQQLTQFTGFNGKLFFIDSNNVSLWSTDATPGDAAQITRWTNGNYAPALGTALNGALLFTADDGVTGDNVWRTDGTSAGTYEIKNVNFRDADSSPDWLTPFNGAIYFTANDGVNGVSLFRTDSTAAGTVRLGPATGNLVVSGGYLYYTRNDAATGTELWRTDGTGPGAIVADATPGAAGTNPLQVTAAGGNVFFLSLSGGSFATLWVTDGTAAGTVALTSQIVTYNPGATKLTAIGSSVYFSAESTGGQELWTSDGTAAGTRLVADLNPGAADSSPYGFSALGSSVVFGGYTKPSGLNLYVSDGTAAGTAVLKKFTALDSLTSFNGAVYFDANDGLHGPSLWRTDGTVAGTYAIQQSTTGPSMLTVAGNALYFLAGGTLYKTDGTASGTVAVHAFGAASNVNQRYMTAVGNTLFYHDGYSLWESDGTFAGTFIVMRVDPSTGSATFNGAGAVAFGDQLLFSAYSELQGRELWQLSLTPPAAPSGLTISPAPAGQVAPAAAAPGATLHWVDNSTNESGFLIERSATANFATIDATFFVGANTTSFIDTSVSTGVYYYRVRAVDAGGNSGNSGAAALDSRPAMVLTATAAGSTFFLRRDANGTSIDVWQDAPGGGGTGTPTSTIALANYSSIQIAGGPGNDSLTLDFSQGDPLPTGGVSFAAGAGANILAVIGSTGDDTLTATSTGLTFSNATLGSIPITVTGVQTLNFVGGSGGNDTLNVDAASYAVNADTAAGAPNVSLNVLAGAAVTLAGTQHLAGLLINTSTVALAAGSALTVSGPLGIAGGGSLDLGSSPLLLSAANNSMNALRSLLSAGYDLGAWNGPGIVSSYVAAMPGMSIGYAKSGEPVTPAIAAGLILIEPALIGDVNLDGKVNGLDTRQIYTCGAFNDGQANHDWSGGDVNYDGTVNGVDTRAIYTSGNFNAATTPTVAAWATLPAPPAPPPAPPARAAVVVRPQAQMPVQPLFVADADVLKDPAQDL